MGILRKGKDRRVVRLGTKGCEGVACGVFRHEGLDKADDPGTRFDMETESQAVVRDEIGSAIEFDLEIVLRDMGTSQETAKVGIAGHPLAATCTGVDKRHIGRRGIDFIPQTGDDETIVVELRRVVLQAATEPFAPMGGVGGVAATQLLHKGSLVVVRIGMIEGVPCAGKIMPDGLGIAVGGKVGIVLEVLGGLDGGAVAESMGQAVEERLVLPHGTTVEVDEGVTVHNGAVRREKKAVGQGLAETFGRGAGAIGGDSHLEVDKLVAMAYYVDKAVRKSVVGRMKAEPVEHLTQGGEGIDHHLGALVGVEAVILVGKGVVGVVGRIVATHDKGDRDARDGVARMGQRVGNRERRGVSPALTGLERHHCYHQK